MDDQSHPVEPPRRPGPDTPHERRIAFDTRFGIVLLACWLPLVVMSAVAHGKVGRALGVLASLCLVLGVGSLIRAAWRGLKRRRGRPR